MKYFLEYCNKCHGELVQSGHVKICQGTCGNKELEEIEKELKSKNLFTRWISRI